MISDSAGGGGSRLTHSAPAGIHRFGARVSTKGEGAHFITPTDAIYCGRIEGSDVFSNSVSTKQAVRALLPTPRSPQEVRAA